MWIRSTLLVILTGFHIGRTADWGYWGDHEPSKWPGTCSTGKQQSPINILTRNTINKDFGELKFIRYDHPFTGKVTNSGHTIRVDLFEYPMQLEIKHLSANYTFVQMHFHWESEHTIDDKRYPLELHLVHYNDDYINDLVASEHKNGLVVLTILFEIGENNNEGLNPIISGAKLVTEWIGGSFVRINGQVTPDLLVPKNRKNYYTYEGSLTTPDCKEVVTWLIMKEKLTVSEEQLEILQNIESPNGTLKFNYRPTQSVGNRKIYYNMPGCSSAPRNHFFLNVFLIIYYILFVKLS
ncbi:PREDICTED: putative carbonic anhydrase 3 [Polistes canadensis]|uniref:putative carbonic anhydrase 3 n=1 Tax=Polistes canadensis TaxID=91411 RepID=UPI000718E8D3|nr:PREDICTED: putative carbonic anhydrase 3 [Polistes canadensis]